MRLKYEKVIHHAIVNNLFRWQYTKKSCSAQGSSKYYLFVTAPFARKQDGRFTMIIQSFVKNDFVVKYKSQIE